MAYYPPPPPHGYHYLQTPYAQAPYPPVPYDSSYYPQHGYPVPPPPPHYPSNQVANGPPPKKRKNNTGSANHVPPSYPPPAPIPAAHGYPYPPAYPPAYQPYPPPVLGAVPPPPIPPPGWVPPPPPGWAGPVPPPPSPYRAQYPAPYPPPVYPPAEQRHRSNSHREKPDAGFARSKQWHNPNGPYGKGAGARAVSAAVSTNSHSSPHSGETPREGSNAPTPPTATPGSVAAVPRSRSQGSLSHARTFSDDLHLDDDDYFVKDDEEANPALSLGGIVWKPAILVNKAMPAEWKQADKYFKELPVPVAKEGRCESRSRYATTEENAMKECGPVKTFENWSKMKDDPIFADLTAESKMITRGEVFANRSRSAVPAEDDFDAEEGEISGAPQYDFTTAADREDGIGSSPPPHYAAFYSHAMPPPPPPPQNPADVPMQGIEDRVGKSPPLPLPQIDDDLIDSAIRSATAALPVKKEPPATRRPSLPQLNPDSIPDLSLPPKPPRGLKRSRSRSTSPERKLPKTSHFPQKPPEWIKDEAQEDILAMLGVSGAPKPVFQTPGPAYTAPPEKYRASSHTPVPGAFAIPPPPPPPPPPQVKLEAIAEDEDDGNPWRSAMDRAATPNSVTSQHTMVGSDFNAMVEDTEATPKASKSMKIKREEQTTPSKSQDLDVTPRPSERKRAPRIHEAFSRRW